MGGKRRAGGEYVVQSGYLLWLLMMVEARVLYFAMISPCGRDQSCYDSFYFGGIYSSRTTVYCQIISLVLLV